MKKEDLKLAERIDKLITGLSERLKFDIYELNTINIKNPLSLFSGEKKYNDERLCNIESDLSNRLELIAEMANLAIARTTNELKNYFEEL